MSSSGDRATGRRIRIGSTSSPPSPTRTCPSASPSPTAPSRAGRSPSGMPRATCSRTSTPAPPAASPPRMTAWPTGSPWGWWGPTTSWSSRWRGTVNFSTYNLAALLQDSPLDTPNFVVGFYDVELEPNNLPGQSTWLAGGVTMYGLVNLSFETTVPAGDGSTREWAQGADWDWYAYSEQRLRADHPHLLRAGEVRARRLVRRGL